MIRIQEFLKLNEFHLKKRNDKTKLIYSGKIADLEDCVEIEQCDSEFNVWEVHRSDRLLRKQVDDKNKAVLYAAILYKKLFDDVFDKGTVRRIRQLVDEGNEAAAYALFEGVNSELFVFGNEEKDKMSLVKENGMAHVIYNGRYIVRDAALSRAFVTLYNYCQKLQTIMKFYNKNKRIFIENEINICQAIEYYIY